LLRTDANVGFSGGNNVGIRFALRRGTEWILLLNNDTVVEPDSLDRLLEAAEDASADLAGCLVYRYYRPDAIWYAGGEFRWWGDKDLKTLPRSAHHGACVLATDWITGCCLLVRRWVFERIGFLDENSFLYSEDADFCRRAAKAGFHRVVALRSRIYHKEGRSAGLGSAIALYHITRSRVYFHAKHYSFFSHAGFLLVFALSRLVKSFRLLLQGRPDLVNATFRGLWDGMLRNVKGHYP
jgi:GT2 family glycosyltransferase